MAYSKYQIWIVLQVIFLGVTSILFALTVSNDFMIVTKATLIIVWIAQLVLLVFHINKIKRDILRFIDGLKSQDTALRFKKEKEDVFFRDLYKGFNEIMRDFRIIRKEKELESQFFNHVMHHITVGLLVLDEDGIAKLHNNAFLKMIEKNEFHRIVELEEIYQNLPQIIQNMNWGESRILQLKISETVKNISLQLNFFKLDNKTLRIVTFHDISKEIDKTEVDSWNKLFRVITHEVMNSVSPIKLLSSGLMSMCEDVDIEQGMKEEITNGLAAIQKRAKGLSAFIENYKKLTKLPDPECKELNIKRLVFDLKFLFKQELESKSIEMNITIDEEDLIVRADEKQIEQVFINIIRNAIDALMDIERGIIKIIAKTNLDRRVEVIIKNNGIEISEEVKENLFVPFFTTKENGSGIGLSLSKQIMRQHGGDIFLNSKKGITSFTLRF